MKNENKIILEEKAINVLKNVSSKITIKKTLRAIEILKDNNIEDESIITAALYIPYVHYHITKEFIIDNFGEDVYAPIKTLSKLHKISLNSKEEEAENIRKMYFALAKDIRIIFIKLSFALAELQVKELMDRTTVKNNAKLVLEIYAPLAARLGASKLKSQLENLAFEIVHPKEFQNIKNDLENNKDRNDRIIKNIKDSLQDIISSLNIKGEIKGRIKHIYSISKKLKAQHKTIDQIYDLIALRILVDTVPECYTILGKINQQFIPIPGRFKDFVAMPKSNGYQSLHTTILYDNFPVEIQIRTFDMHKSAEYGYAAHWMYKEKRKKQDSLDEKLGWIREVLEKEKLSDQDIIDTLKVDIYNDEIFVQSPLGKVIHLPKNATPIDFAYHIHSDVGNKCVGAKINNKIKPLTTKLKNGNVVEIITNPNSKGPSRDWLKIVKTLNAKNKIKYYFRKEMKEENIKLGKNMLETSAKNNGVALSTLLSKKATEMLEKKYLFSDIEEFYSSIGNGSINTNTVINKLLKIYKDSQNIDNKIENIKNNTKRYKNNSNNVKISGADNLLISFANCCKPIPNDDIIGYITIGKGIKIHRANCPHVQYYDPDRLIEVEWASNNNNEYLTALNVKIKTKSNALAKIMTYLEANKITLISLNVENLSQTEDLVKIQLGIKDKNTLKNLINKIKVLENVNDVFRSTTS